MGRTVKSLLNTAKRIALLDIGEPEDAAMWIAVVFGIIAIVLGLFISHSVDLVMVGLVLEAWAFLARRLRARRNKD